MSNAATLTVNPSAPSIVLQPANQTVTAGDTAGFTVAAVGSEPFSYQWRKDGRDLSDGGGISGAASATLSISSVAEADAGSYSCYITNSAGNATSNSATLAISPQHTGPAVMTQPEDKTVAQGGTVTFTVSASGNTPLTYQWKKNGANLSNGGCISGVNSSTLRITNLQNSDAGMYSCLVSNDYGNALSDEARLTISRPLARINIAQPPVKIIPNSPTFESFFRNVVNGQIWSPDSTVDHFEYQRISDGDTFDINGIWTQDSVFSIDPGFKGRLYARSVYGDGITSDYVMKTLIVDSTAPNISALYNDLSGTIAATVTDNGAGIKTITYQVGPGAQQTIYLEPSTAQPNLTTEHEFTINGLQVGQYDVIIDAADNSGNAADTETVGINRADTLVTGITVTGAGGAESVGVGHTLQMRASVSPANTIHKTVTWSIESGSSRASIDAAGLLTTTAAGPVTVRATAQDSSGVYGEKEITITAPVAPPVITTDALPNGTVHESYGPVTLTADGDTPIEWSIASGSLPDGLMLSIGGVISGTPTAAGTSNFTVRAENSVDEDTKDLSIAISAAAPSPTH